MATMGDCWSPWDGPPSANDPSVYVGVVNRLIPTKGYGFVVCKESYAKYGNDVFLHSSQLDGLQEGMQVSFKVNVNAKGMPQAVDLSVAGTDQLIEDDSAASVAVLGLSPSRPVGVQQQRSTVPPRRVVSPPSSEPAGTEAQAWYDAVIGGGAAIGVPTVLEGIVGMTGDLRGVRAATAEWLHLSISRGDESETSASANINIPSTPIGSGGPRKGESKNNGGGWHENAAGWRSSANDHRGGPYWQKASGCGKGGCSNGGFGDAAWTKGGCSILPVSSTSEDGSTRFEGVVTHIKQPSGDRPGFGFVSCAETMQLYGDDVFLHSSQSSELQVGERVSFQVKLSGKGKPQAIDVIIVTPS
eukprot:TRINITY_DN76861_c0_g1_i1.p1 TRINITY_DN76861_c0_g1~~TRINITY_DN76861_c0_g1_i1.p1  ORF type:complete len:358 (+),score=51.90 TRINITY_DN76861_c0_g1_i1:82-1155(+)